MVSTLLLVALLSVVLFFTSIHAEQCSAGYIPSTVSTSPYTIQPKLDTLPKTVAIADLFLSGNFVVKDGCTVELQQFVYYPALDKTYLYGSKGAKADDASASGFRISRTAVLGANNMTFSFKLDAGKSLNDFDMVKLFSESSNVVIGLVDLTNASSSLGGASGGSSATQSSNAVASFTSEASLLLGFFAAIAAII